MKAKFINEFTRGNDPFDTLGIGALSKFKNINFDSHIAWAEELSLHFLKILKLSELPDDFAYVKSHIINAKYWNVIFEYLRNNNITILDTAIYNPKTFLAFLRWKGIYKGPIIDHWTN